MMIGMIRLYILKSFGNLRTHSLEIVLMIRAAVLCNLKKFTAEERGVCSVPVYGNAGSVPRTCSSENGENFSC